MQVVGINIHPPIMQIPDSLFAFPKGFLINLRLAPGAFKTLRLRRIRQLKALIFSRHGRGTKVYEQKTFAGTLKGVWATCL